MAPASDAAPFTGTYDVLKKAREHVFLLIDTNEMRAQNIARLLTLTGSRAIVTSTTLIAFDRYLKERFKPRAVLVNRQVDTGSTIFSRFTKHLVQELRHEVPILFLDAYTPDTGFPLYADAAVSTSAHVISQQGAQILQRIWQVVPSAQVPLAIAQNTLILESLPKYGFIPHVARIKRTSSSHLFYELNAAKQTIAADQWDTLMRDVGLAGYCDTANWPANEDEYTVHPGDLALLTRAVMFSDPAQPLQQVRRWTELAGSDAQNKQMLMFIMKQFPKIIGVKQTLRSLLNLMVNEHDRRCGEKLSEWRQLPNGSFAFVCYSNMFMYGMMGSEVPLCEMWLAIFDLTLRLAKQERHWEVREVECSAQTHTGHCVFMITPKKKR